MKNATFNGIADHIANLPARSDHRIADIGPALLGRLGEQQRQLFPRALVAAAVPLIPRTDVIRYADVDVELQSLGSKLYGTAIIVTDDLVVELTMEASQYDDPWDAIRNVFSKTNAFRRSDVSSVEFRHLRAPSGNLPGAADWTPTGEVILHTRHGREIELRSFDGASIAELGNVLSD